MSRRTGDSQLSRERAARRLAIPALAAALALAAPLRAQSGGELSAALGVAESLPTGEQVTVRFELTNHSDDDLRLLEWDTPLEGLLGEIFRVERDGEPVPYEGIVMKRGVPTADEYVDIPAGGSRSAEVDLAEGWDFSAAGDYDIAFVSPRLSDLTRGRTARRMAALEAVPMPAPAVRVRVESSYERSVPPPPPARMAAERQSFFSDCSASQSGVLTSAEEAALAQSARVDDYLATLTPADQPGDRRYKTWYGAHSPARYGVVSGNWANIRDAFDNRDISYNCDGPHCKPSTYAYVLRGGKIEVFLCPKYWSRPASGVDSQSGILIHELSHEVASTADHTYGTANCKNLAQSEPDKASDNADNYEYFAEQYDVGGAVPAGMAALLAALALAVPALLRRRRARRETFRGRPRLRPAAPTPPPPARPRATP